MSENFSHCTEELVDALRVKDVEVIMQGAGANCVTRRTVVLGQKRLVIAFTDSGILDALSRRYEFEPCNYPGLPIDVLVDWSPKRPGRLIVADVSGQIDLFDTSNPAAIHFASKKNGELQFAGSWGGVEATALHGDAVASASGLTCLAADQALAAAFMRALPEYICLHAAVVVSESSSIMLIGPSGAGKSTISSLLSSDTAYIFADDLVAYSSKLNCVIRLPRWSAGYRGPRRESFRSCARGEGGASHIVFIGLKSRCRTKLLELDPIAALQRIGTSLIMGPPRCSALGFQSVSALVTHSRCWELTPLEGAPKISAGLLANLLEG
ncbi:hypothetical protein [Achromobacter xylosoxidans]|uniref:hypothetical protein n=1 Tax=Alcaligenes xylosoxydans xylosoxydans TaxID=85698 RepID=UPI001177E96C|nr:hypothetical protein [Achromobacter xylosoxidans]